MKTARKITTRKITSIVCASSIAILNIMSKSLGQSIIINTYNGITPTTLDNTTFDSIINSLIINQPSAGNWNYIPDGGNINVSNIFSSNGIGNIINYGVSIASPQQTFTLSEISWSSATLSSFTSGTFGDQGLTFDSFGIGINYGPDGILGTTDDIYYSTGNSDTPVNAVYVLGMASTVDIGNLSTSDALLAIASSYPSRETISYTLQNVTASTTVNFVTDSVDYIQSVPEPSTYLMFGLGISALILIQNRRQI